MKKSAGFYLAVILLMAIAGLSFICGTNDALRAVRAYDFSDEARLTNIQLGLESEEPFAIRCYRGDCRVSIHLDTDSLALLQEVHTNLGLAIQFLKSRQTGKGGE